MKQTHEVAALAKTTARAIRFRAKAEDIEPVRIAGAHWWDAAAVRKLVRQPKAGPKPRKRSAR